MISLLTVIKTNDLSTDSDKNQWSLYGLGDENQLPIYWLGDKNQLPIYWLGD